MGDKWGKTHCAMCGKPYLLPQDAPAFVRAVLDKPEAEVYAHYATRCWSLVYSIDTCSKMSNEQAIALRERIDELEGVLRKIEADDASELARQEAESQMTCIPAKTTWLA